MNLYNNFATTFCYTAKQLVLNSLLVLFLSGVCFTVSAQKDKANVDENAKKQEAKENSERFNNLVLAQQLANYGTKSNSAEALYTAAKIVMENPSGDINTSKKEETNEKKDNTDSGNTNATANSVELDPKTLLEKAKNLAKDNTELIAMIDELSTKVSSQITTKGSTYGPYRKYDQVNAYATDSYEIIFNGGYLAEIRLSGDGDTDLDLYVYDEYGNLIRSHTSHGDDCYVSWHPRSTGRYYVKVKNRGNVYNSYVLMTN